MPSITEVGTSFIIFSMMRFFPASKQIRIYCIHKFIKFIVFKSFRKLTMAPPNKTGNGLEVVGIEIDNAP